LGFHLGSLDCGKCQTFATFKRLGTQVISSMYWYLTHFCDSISHKRVDTCAINATGEWLAFGCSALGQLLVWEWQSESYVLKQQGHYYDMNTVDYSPDGQYIATGADDGKLKMWNTFSGYCFITFTEHKAAISQVQFAKNGQIVFSASLDGTVRAFDMNRYRCFRTFTSPTPVQFSSLAVDPSGEIVCAGSLDTFEVYVWSVQTGKLLDILKGHEGPISSLAFSPTDPWLLSGSWDHTVRVWDVFGRGSQVDILQGESEVLAIAVRPDGKEVAASSLKGQIAFWNIKDAIQTSSIEGRNDLASGRRVADRMTAANAAVGRSFNSVCYTADGACILAGGNSKFVCIYDVSSSILLKRFQISQNNSLDGMKEFLNSKHMTEAGPKQLLDDVSEEDSDVEERKDKSLPGSTKADLSKRTTMPEIRTKCVKFSPNGRSWAAAATEGLLIYSLDDGIHFDPFDLELDITPANIFHTLRQKEYLKALVMSLRLNEKYVIERIYHGIPPLDVPHVAKELPSKYLEQMLKFIAARVETSKHIEFHILWASQLFKYHTMYMKQNSGRLASSLRSLRKGVVLLREQLTPV
jgi:periodic tryptophan protein 2